MDGSALIVEDHPLYRDALTNLLRPVAGIREVHAASSAEEGLRVGAAMLDLRLILLDPGLPGTSGVEAIAKFSRAFPGAALIAVSASEDRREAAAAVRAGALAFVSKAVSADVLAALVARVLAGEIQPARWITPEGDRLIVEESAAALTPRQREILMLLCHGHGNKEIGLRLGLAEVTVKMHLSSVFRVLEVANRTQAVLAARRLGLHTEE